MPIKVVEGSEPLVSIVSPIYNGEKYLAACIESVLAQTYRNWEYILIDNCSKDGSLKIAQEYAELDERIRVSTNHDHWAMIPDWNYAMRQISPESQFCKVIHTDDWLFPDCISAMVEVAMQSENIGLVSAYRLNGTTVDLNGLTYPSEITSGREIGRRSLSRNPLWLFGSPSSVLYRSDLVQERDPFYDESIIHADSDVCLDILQNHDFGFVHQVLTYTRRHEESVSSSIDAYGTRRVEKLLMLQRYGPVFLSDEEFQERMDRKLRAYHVFLVQSLFRAKPADFWQYHKGKRDALGIQLQGSFLLKPFIKEVIQRLLHLRQTVRQISHRSKRQPISRSPQVSGN